MELFNYTERNKWIENITNTFSFHRSFTWAIVLINSLIFLKLKNLYVQSKLIYTIITLIFLQILTGVIMYYFHFPFSSQPIHLLISTLIIGLQFYFLSLYNLKKNATKI